MTRSQPLRVNTVSWTAISISVPACRRPPISEYSPSLFSRTTTRSRSSGVTSRSGELHARPQPHRALVHVLLEAAADGDQQAPERDVVGHVVAAHGAQEDCVGRRQPVQRVRGHHRARLHVVVAAPRVLGQRQLEAVRAARGRQHLQRRRRDLGADAVAGDDRYLVSLVVPTPLSYPAGALLNLAVALARPRDLVLGLLARAPPLDLPVAALQLAVGLEEVLDLPGQVARQVVQLVQRAPRGVGHRHPEDLGFGPFTGLQSQHRYRAHRHHATGEGGLADRHHRVQFVAIWGPRSPSRSRTRWGSSPPRTGGGRARSPPSPG